MLNTKLNNSIKPCLHRINSDCIVLRITNLTSIDILDLGMLYIEAVEPLFANWS
jgi:hypothetical protein